MTVFVVMSNDFPDSVFSTESAAEQYIEQKLEQQRVAKGSGGFFGSHIHWRWYEFELRG